MKINWKKRYGESIKRYNYLKKNIGYKMPIVLTEDEEKAIKQFDEVYTSAPNQLSETIIYKVFDELETIKNKKEKVFTNGWIYIHRYDITCTRIACEYIDQPEKMQQLYDKLCIYRDKIRAEDIKLCAQEFEIYNLILAAVTKSKNVAKFYQERTGKKAIDDIDIRYFDFSIILAYFRSYIHFLKRLDNDVTNISSVKAHDYHSFMCRRNVVLNLWCKKYEHFFHRNLLTYYSDNMYIYNNTYEDI